MARTLTFRIKAVRQGKPKPNQLFLSHKTGLPVARNTISRWLKEVMSLAGIDTTYLKGHSRREQESVKLRAEVPTPINLSYKVIGQM